jgi:tetratricopeptide (TPR) repeat protein
MIGVESVRGVCRIAASPHMARALGLIGGLAVLVLFAAANAYAQDPSAVVEQDIALAEASLRAGELQLAESHYRDALMHGWMVVGAVRAAEGQLAEAREAFRRATHSAVGADGAFRALALVHLRLGEPAAAVAILTALVGRHPKDVPLRQVLTQALLASGQPEQAVQELEEARAASPDDPELAFLLAAGYLRLENVAAADALFTEIVRARPMAQTHVLIGRTYRDAGQYDRARAALRRALEADARVRRAHYYLGTIAVLEEGVVRLDEAIAEFQQELALAPKDPITNLRLGMALVEAQRPRDALGPLEIAVRAEAPAADAFHYMGRCRLALGQPAEAVTALRRALDLSSGPAVDDLRLLGIHYQLAQALRAAGRPADAARHFTEAETLSAKRAQTSRERLTTYLANAQESATSPVPLPLPPEVDRLATIPATERAAIESRVRGALARAALNIGVMHAQAQRFARAADLFETAAAADPDFPQVQYSLGIAYFNDRAYDRAHAPLTRAWQREPANAELTRMLAVSSLESGRFEQAAALLADDPARDTDPSLQYAYGLALVRSGQASLAEAVFSRLIATHGGTPEMNVVLGQAHAQQGDFDAAIAALQQALRMKPAVADASAALGVIYLKQGRLDEAAAVLRDGLKHHPADRAAAHTLAAVLDLQGASDEAIGLLGPLLQRHPQDADARYLLGKMLLARGAANEAVAHLETAAALAPEDANVHFQLAQAYRALGRSADAQQRFEIYQRLKDKRRTQ